MKIYLGINTSTMSSTDSGENPSKEYTADDTSAKENLKSSSLVVSKVTEPSHLEKSPSQPSDSDPKDSKNPPQSPLPPDNQTNEKDENPTEENPPKNDKNDENEKND